MTRIEFQNRFPLQYRWLLKNNRALLDKILPSQMTTWSFELCLLEALKYKTRTEWQKNSNSSYRHAYNNKILDECCEHMTILRHKLTKKSCLLESKKYKYRNNFRINSPAFYRYARKHKILDECCEHMNRSSSGKRMPINQNTGEIFSSIILAGKSISQGSAGVSAACQGKQKTAGGYHWAYFDEWFDKLEI